MAPPTAAQAVRLSPAAFWSPCIWLQYCSDFMCIHFELYNLYTFGRRRRKRKKRYNYNIASKIANKCKCKRSNKLVFKQRDVNRKITVGGILSYNCQAVNNCTFVVFQVFCSNHQVQASSTRNFFSLFFGAGVVQIKHIRCDVCIVTSI